MVFDDPSDKKVKTPRAASEVQGFWSEGLSWHLGAVKEELASLRERLLSASPAEREELETEIERVRREYRDRRRSAGDNLYFCAEGGKAARKKGDRR